MRMQRIFVIDGKEVKDQFPSFTVDQVKKALADDYPNIINSSWTQKIDETKGALMITFAGNTVGTRG